MTATLKVRIARVVGSRPIGRLVRSFYRNRIPWNGGRLFVDDARVSDATCAQIFWGLYESAERRMAKRFVKPGDSVLELGSSIGGMTCVLNRIVGRQGKVGMIEAREDLLELALKNVAANNPNKAMPRQQGAIDYSQPNSPTISFSTSGTNIEGHVDASAAHDRVPRFTLAQVLRQLPGPWDVLVADIEGAEVGLALHDMPALLHFRRIILELHETSFGGRAYSIDDAAALLVRSNQFRLAGRDGNVFCYERIN